MIFDKDRWQKTWGVAFRENSSRWGQGEEGTQSGWVYLGGERDAAWRFTL